METDQAIRLAIEALRFKKNHLYRQGFLMHENGSKNFFNKNDHENYTKIEEAMNTLERMVSNEAG